MKMARRKKNWKQKEDKYKCPGVNERQFSKKHV